MSFPSVEEIEESARRFWIATNFPNVWAALDGKHFRIRNPTDGGNAYRCYKGIYSVNVQGKHSF